MTLDNLMTIVIVAIVAQAIWIIWFTTAIASMQRSLQEIRHNSNATAFKIERLDSHEFAALNRTMAATRNGLLAATCCGRCGRDRYSKPAKPVAYLRRHGVPVRLCIDCAEKEHRAALRPWDSEEERAAVAELTAEAEIDKK